MRTEQDLDSTIIETIDPIHTAGFICDHTRELAGLAENSGLETLGYVLRMAEQEAQNIIAASAPQKKAA